MRTAGDLVARVQISRGMRIQEAKEYVANKLSVSVAELTDPIIMNEMREDLNLGLVNPQPGLAMGIEAKARIEELLGIKINSLQKFRKKSGM